MTTHLLFLAGLLTLPLFGLATWRLPATQTLDREGRIAVAGAAGALVVALVMAMESLLHIEWSRTTLLIPLAVIAVLSARKLPKATSQRAWLILPFVILTAYGLLTARETIGDLLFFWGPKAIRFYHAGAIDPAILLEKTHANRDYPPLLPLVYAYCQTLSRQFSWWMAVLSSALFVFGAVLIVRSTSRDNPGALLMAATLSWSIAIAGIGGGADAPLIFFEVLALAALTFLNSDVLAAIGLAGAAFTKIEGSTFVIAVVIAVILVQRNVKRALLIATPAAILMAAWVAFLIANGLIWGYGGATMGVHLSALPKVVPMIARTALYELWGLPWIVPIILLIVYRPRTAVLPLIVTALTLVVTVFFYIHLEDAGWWVASSAPRVLLTPLTSLLIAACSRNP